MENESKFSASNILQNKTLSKSHISQEDLNERYNYFWEESKSNEQQYSISNISSNNDIDLEYFHIYREQNIIHPIEENKIHLIKLYKHHDSYLVNDIKTSHLEKINENINKPPYSNFETIMTDRKKIDKEILSNKKYPEKRTTKDIISKLYKSDIKFRRFDLDNKENEYLENINNIDEQIKEEDYIRKNKKPMKSISDNKFNLKNSTFLVEESNKRLSSFEKTRIKNDLIQYKYNSNITEKNKFIKKQSIFVDFCKKTQSEKYKNSIGPNPSLKNLNFKLPFNKSYDSLDVQSEFLISYLKEELFNSDSSMSFPNNNENEEEENVGKSNNFENDENKNKHINIKLNKNMKIKKFHEKKNEKNSNFFNIENKKLETIESSQHENIKESQKCCFFKCLPSNYNTNKIKKRNKSEVILNSYFSTINNTKRSTNHSFKSIKLNDSLTKLRKKKLSICTTDRDSKCPKIATVNTIISANNSNIAIGKKDKKSGCGCVIF